MTEPLIFTSDHATYPSSDFKQTFNSSSDYFVDRIPLFFYTKNIQPKIVDANNRNSLDFAPTVLNILNINSKNYFLGRSLFNINGSTFSKISYINEDFYDTSTGNVIKTSPPLEIINKIKNFVLIFG